MRTPQNGGFIQIILLAIVIIALLAYFNVDLHTVFQMPIVKQLISIIVGAWDNFIFPLLKYLKDSLTTLINSAGTMATSTATTTAQALGK